MIIISSVFLIKNIFLVGGFVIYGSNLLSEDLFLAVTKCCIHIEINFKDLFLDFIYLRDMDFINIRNIIEQFLIDKPTTYVVIGFLILNIVSLFKYKFNLQTDELLFFFVLLNYILVNLLISRIGEMLSLNHHIDI